MESLPVRRRSCLLRLRANCPFRKLRRRSYDVSAASSSPIGPDWNNVSLPANNQLINTVCSPNQSKANFHMEENPPSVANQQNQQQNQLNRENQQHNPESRDEDCMELDDDVDPETGERAQG